jgi:WD40 repeat protein
MKEPPNPRTDRRDNVGNRYSFYTLQKNSKIHAAAVWNPAWLLVANGTALQGWNLLTKSMFSSKTLPSKICKLTSKPNNTVWAVLEDGSVLACKATLNAIQTLEFYKLNSIPTLFTFVQDRLYVSCKGEIIVLKPEDASILSKFSNHTADVVDLLPLDSNSVVSMEENGTVFAWDLNSGQGLWSWKPKTSPHLAKLWKAKDKGVDLIASFENSLQIIHVNGSEETVIATLSDIPNIRQIQVVGEKMLLIEHGGVISLLDSKQAIIIHQFPVSDIHYIFYTPLMKHRIFLEGVYTHVIEITQNRLEHPLESQFQ